MKPRSIHVAAALFFCLSVPFTKATAAVYSFSSAPISFESQLSLGFQFTTNTAVTVTALGYFDDQGDGFLTQHEVGIFNSLGNLLTSAILGAGTANPLSDGFRYQSIAPIVLGAGETFTIAATTFGSDPWAYGNAYGPGAPPFFGVFTGFTVDPAITIAADSARFVSQDDNVLRDPDQHFSNYTVYAGPNFEIASDVPETSTLIMMLLGFAGIGGLAYRRATKSAAVLA